MYTKGAEGAFAYTKKTSAFSEGLKVNAVDTTGAGDAFIGSFLYSLYERNISDVTELFEKEMREMLSFSNRYCAKSVMKNGAIESYPTLEEMNL